MTYSTHRDDASTQPTSTPDEADLLNQLEFFSESAIRRAFVLPPERGVSLKSVDVTVLPIPTVPECSRKRFIVRTRIEVQADGDSLDGLIREVAEEIRDGWDNVK